MKSRSTGHPPLIRKRTFMELPTVFSDQVRLLNQEPYFATYRRVTSPQVDVCSTLSSISHFSLWWFVPHQNGVHPNSAVVSAIWRTYGV